MKSIQYLTIAFTALICSSCNSHLYVNVQSFDMDKMYRSKEYLVQSRRDELKNYQAILNSNIFDQSERDIKVIVKNTIEPAIGKQITKEDANRFIANGSLKLHDVSNNFKNAIATLASDLELLIFEHSNSAQAKEDYLNSYNNFLMAKKNYYNLCDGVFKDLSYFKGFPEKVEKACLEINNSSNFVKIQQVSGNTFGTPITDDNMASFIVKAPEHYWTKYTSKFYYDENNLTKTDTSADINITKIGTCIGNSDIAVIMDGPANFIVKGVRIDADEAFRTSFKVLSQSIRYMSLVAGLPLKATSKNTETNPVAKIPELESFEQNKQQAENLDSQYQQLTASFLQVLDKYHDDLKAKNSRKNAIAAIKAAYTYYQSQLQLAPATVANTTVTP